MVVKPFVRADNHQPAPRRNLPEAGRGVHWQYGHRSAATRHGRPVWSCRHMHQETIVQGAQFGSAVGATGSKNRRTVDEFG